MKYLSVLFLIGWASNELPIDDIFFSHDKIQCTFRRSGSILTLLEEILFFGKTASEVKPLPVTIVDEVYHVVSGNRRLWVYKALRLYFGYENFLVPVKWREYDERKHTTLCRGEWVLIEKWNDLQFDQKFQDLYDRYRNLQTSEEPYISPSGASSTESIERLPSKSQLTSTDTARINPWQALVRALPLPRDEVGEPRAPGGERVSQLLAHDEDNSPKAQDVERLRFKLRQAAACFQHASKLILEGRDKTEVCNELSQIPGFTWLGRIIVTAHNKRLIHCEVMHSKFFLAPSQVKHGKPWRRLEHGEPVLFEIGSQPRFPNRMEAKNVEHFPDGAILFERLP